MLISGRQAGKVKASVSAHISCRYHACGKAQCWTLSRSCTTSSTAWLHFGLKSFLVCETSNCVQWQVNNRGVLACMPSFLEFPKSRLSSFFVGLFFAKTYASSWLKHVYSITLAIWPALSSRPKEGAIIDAGCVLFKSQQQVCVRIVLGHKMKHSLHGFAHI